MELKSTIDATSSIVQTASKEICGNMDIMERILGFLQDNDTSSLPSDASRKDLLAACLVSKSFFLDPALTVLWCHLDSLLPVLRLFPTFQKDEESGDWSLTGTVSNDDLQRVLFYSRRIRSIRITPPSITTADTLILSSRMQPLQPFLPLTNLIIEITPGKSILDPIVWIMPPTLTAISITGISPELRIAVASLLQHLSSSSAHASAPPLKSLSLTGSLSPTLLPILLECTSLRVLTLISSEIVFTADYLEELSEALTSLESLSLNQLRSNGASNPSLTGTSFPPTAIFASLLELTLTADLPCLSSILATLKAPKLREITLSFLSSIRLDTPDAANFAACVAQVAKINGLEGKGNLRAVKISHTNPFTCIDMSAFDPLDTLRTTLQVLHLQPNRLHFELKKEYKNPFHTGLVYPNLVDLRFSFQPSLLPDVASKTLGILPFLALMCPNLKTLHISIHAGQELEEDKLKRIATFKLTDLPPHGLQTLVFHHLPRNWKFSMSLAISLARYLNYLFPILSSAEYCEKEMSEEVKEWWTGVQNMLKMCKGEEGVRRTAIMIANLRSK